MMSWSEDDREFIVEAIRESCSNEEIVEMLPHVSLGSVIAFRAHVTRGTYDPIVVERPCWPHLRG